MGDRGELGVPDVGEIRDALGRSGYLLEARVARVLRLRDAPWFVRTNTRYLDPTSSAPREIDLIATHSERLDSAGLAIPGYHTVGSVLCVECINNPFPVVLVRSSERSPEYALDTALSGALSGAKVGGNPLSKAVRLSELHHQHDSLVATQFCDLSRKQNGPNKGQLMALHSDRSYGCLESLAQSMELNSRRGDKPFREICNLWVVYGCAVLQGPLYAADVDEDGGYDLREVDHGVYRMTLVSREDGRPTEYLIDMVQEGYFEAYAEQLETTGHGVVDRLRPFEDELSTFIANAPSIAEHFQAR